MTILLPNLTRATTSTTLSSSSKKLLFHPTIIIILTSILFSPRTVVVRGRTPAFAFTRQRRPLHNILQRDISSPASTTTTTTTPFFWRFSDTFKSTHSYRSQTLCFSTTNDLKEEIMEEDNNKQAYPLIDVDCNLLHPDLISLLSPDPDDVHDNNKEEKTSNKHHQENDEAMLVEPELRILHHPSTTKSNIVAMISPSSTIDESKRSVELFTSASASSSSSYSKTNNILIRTTVGVHPYHTQECGDPSDIDESSSSSSIEQLRTLLNHEEYKQVISCIGETGLDYSPGFPQKNFQLPWFTAQLDLAFEYNLPLFVHERLAFEDTTSCIDDAIARHHHDGKKKQHPMLPKIIIHCFTGTQTECIEYIQRGYYISLSGYFLKSSGENSDEVKSCLRQNIIPLEKLMIETDAPYMGFNDCRCTFYDEEGELLASLNGKKRKRLLKGIYPNVPSSLTLVLKGVVDVLNEGRRERGEEELSCEELGRITTENAVEFFGFPKESIF